MKCSIWKSARRELTYVYLAPGRDFAELPAGLRDAFGEPEFVMDLELAPGRRLAYGDAAQVRLNLAEQGYHLQLPPTDDPTGLLELTGKRRN
ncbi:MAG: YcgL domain-containing protein [Lysobacterales bacterium]|jgi:uncharacterized protein YcgL (UPF0745 family)